MGNAYFAHFFNVSQNPRTLKQSMSAYRQAEKDPVARSDPDLNFNKGVALLYEEDYPAALASFDRALALEPEWEKPQLYKRNIIKKLQQVGFNIYDVHTKGQRLSINLIPSSHNQRRMTVIYTIFRERDQAQ